MWVYFSPLDSEDSSCATILVEKTNIFLISGVMSFQTVGAGTSLAVQWLSLHTSNEGGTGLIPGQRTKIPHAMRCGCQKKEGIKIVGAKWAASVFLHNSYFLSGNNWVRGRSHLQTFTGGWAMWPALTNEREAEGKCITSERKWGNLDTIPGFLLCFCRDPGATS